MKRDDLADLMAFAVIAEERSFTRAAVRLGLSSSALSHAIRLLEDRLGTKLLSRTTRSVAPTAAGERLLARLAPALDEISEGVEALNEERDRPSGLVRINSHQSAALLHVVPKLRELRRLYPDIVVDLTTNDGLVDIVTAGYDAGIRHGEHLARDMVAVRISPEYQSAVVASPEYMRDRAQICTPSDLSDHDCLTWRYPTSGAPLRWEFQRGTRKLAFVPEPVFTTNDIEVMIDAALSGIGIAYLLREQVAGHLEAGRLTELLPDWSTGHGACFLYYPDRRQIRPAMRAVIDALRYVGSPQSTANRSRGNGNHHSRGLGNTPAESV
ncbi:LysR family transcriptional regulator [Paenirhodobacter populi]|uniref:LysR family transcriptional regulator n=1 Tax=Paenirhodobacter populi TaxID=2306993 RepID=A0A443IKJ6_9RHOB|nr:LysR family transcriptional regulator [Sinirhodobacter populi]RWR05196.1 LysR family transcriptional regulator [Sinirhodobacter populi]